MTLSATSADADRQFVNRTVEAAIRVGVLAVLAFWCFRIAQPFVVPIIWGVVIAVATLPAYRWLETRLGGRSRLAAAVFTSLLLLVLIVPSFLLADSMVAGVRRAAAAFQAGGFHIPAPAESAKGWPLVGNSVHDFWQLASENTAQALQQLAPYLKGAGSWLLSAVTGAGLATLQFVLAILIAGAVLAHAEAGGRASYALARRLSPARGTGYAELAEKTLRSVAAGVLGVAFVQGLLAGLGFLVAGVPGAGLLTLICVVLAIVQVGVVVVLAPVSIYLFSSADTVTAVAFLVWAILVTPVDNILKPMLLGRGVKVPMAIVFIGSIGGFINAGFIGLFVGAVIFSLGYELFVAWLGQTQQETPAQG